MRKNLVKKRKTQSLVAENVIAEGSPDSLPLNKQKRPKRVYPISSLLYIFVDHLTELRAHVKLLSATINFVNREPPHSMFGDSYLPLLERNARREMCT
jgi:hypothetical protein